MADTPQFFHSSYDRDEINYIHDKRNQDKFRSLGVKMKREGPGTLVFSSNSSEDPEKASEDLEKGFDELNQIRARYFKPISRRVMVTKDMVGYFRGQKSKHFEQVKEKTYVDNVFFNNIVDRNDVEMVEIVVFGTRPAVSNFMFEVLRSISSLLQKQKDFELPSREDREESRAAARAEREERQKEEEAEEAESADGWEKKKSKKEKKPRKEKPKVDDPEEPDEEESEVIPGLKVKKAKKPKLPAPKEEDEEDEEDEPESPKPKVKKAKKPKLPPAGAADDEDDDDDDDDEED